MKARSRIVLVFVASLACLAVGSLLVLFLAPPSGIFFEGTLDTLYPYARYASLGYWFVTAGLGLLIVAMIAAVILGGTGPLPGMKARSRIVLMFVASLACLAVGSVLVSFWAPVVKHVSYDTAQGHVEGTLGTLYPYASLGYWFVIAGLALLSAAMIAAVILGARRLLARAIEREVARQMGRGNKTT